MPKLNYLRTGNENRKSKLEIDTFYDYFLEPFFHHTQVWPQTRQINIDVKEDQVFLDVFVSQAINIAGRSPDPSTKVGCVIFDNDDTAIHAEMNAVLFSHAPRTLFKDSIVIVSLMPCPQCYKLLAQMRVKWVVVLSDSGRYCGTLNEMLSLNGTGPDIITFDEIATYLNEEFVSNTKIFKENLAVFDKSISDHADIRVPFTEFKEKFDFNYRKLHIHHTSNTVNRFLDLVFRVEQ